uniref:VWFD domain-containing protein n=1 Tax=Timema tahoe TaxID=61484 RepID=A0A7R9FII2_9NEOP|nr:unnamed protein product [Timema tahoe]
MNLRMLHYSRLHRSASIPPIHVLTCRCGESDLCPRQCLFSCRAVCPCPSGNGFVVDSQHFFTLDNRHFTFKGSCSYVLLQDVVDGNFTVILNVDNGKFGSLLLADDKDSLELLADKSLLVNGERSEFPAHIGLLSAWRRYHWANLKSTAGVLVYVDAHTDLIAVTVSGFYHGRTRGLLGTLSYEPADDLIKPDGQFATKENEFGNSWKVGQCKDVTGHSHHDHETVKSSECSDKFTRGSTLSLCFPVLNPAPFREACDHAVEEASSAEAKKAAACAVASAYLYACSEDVPIILPSECAECKLVGGGNPVAVGDLFSVKAPQRSADIVVVVEQVTGSAELYKELVGPLVTTLTNELKSKGVTIKENNTDEVCRENTIKETNKEMGGAANRKDVHFHLVGFGGDLRWPTHYTSSGELSFNGKSKNLKFTTPAEPLPFDTRENKVRWFKHELEVELGLNPAGEAFREVLDYPFRAGASKAVLVVLGQSCELSKLSGVVSITSIHPSCTFHVLAHNTSLHPRITSIHRGHSICLLTIPRYILVSPPSIVDTPFACSQYLVTSSYHLHPSWTFRVQAHNTSLHPRYVTIRAVEESCSLSLRELNK